MINSRIARLFSFAAFEDCPCLGFGPVEAPPRLQKPLTLSSRDRPERWPRLEKPPNEPQAERQIPALEIRPALADSEPAEDYFQTAGDSSTHQYPGHDRVCAMFPSKKNPGEYLELLNLR